MKNQFFFITFSDRSNDLLRKEFFYQYMYEIAIPGSGLSLKDAIYSWHMNRGCIYDMDSVDKTIEDIKRE